MYSWSKAIGFGVLMWLIPFVIAVIVFGIHETNRPLFESIMAVTVTSCAVFLGLSYLSKVKDNVQSEALRAGILWLIISVLIDAPMMLFGGPMYMTIGQYISDIGITYLIIPVVLFGLGKAKK